SSMTSAMATSTGVGGSVYPGGKNGQSFLKKHYKVISGSLPTNANDIVLIVDKDNSTNINALKNIGFSVKNGQKINFDKLIGTKVKVVSNNNYYQKLPTGNFVPNSADSSMYNKDDNTTLKISGILRVKSKSSENILASGIAYSDQLTKNIIKQNESSDIVT